MQEGLYKSIMDNNLNDQNRDSNGDARADHDSDQSSSTRTSSGSVNISTQLATDEAIARQMQELENLHILTSSNEFTGNFDIIFKKKLFGYVSKS